MRRYIKVILLVVFFIPTTAQAILIRQNDLTLDTESGLYWVPVDPLSGALVPEDLPPPRRYATSAEVEDLLDRHVRIYSSLCDFRQGPCDPTAYQAIVGFIDIMSKFALPGPRLQAVYAADDFGSLTLSLFAHGNIPEILLDQQGGNPPPLSGEFGMFLISEVPEPSTLVLFSLGVALIVGRGFLKLPSH